MESPVGLSCRFRRKTIVRCSLLSKELEIEYAKKFIGKNVSVLIERGNDKYSIGHTTNYLAVKIYNKKYNSEELVDVRLKDIEYPFVIGE